MAGRVGHTLATEISRSGAALAKKRGPALHVASQADLVVRIVMTGLANVRVPSDAALPRLAHGRPVVLDAAGFGGVVHETR